MNKATTIRDWNKDLSAFGCMDRIPEIQVGKYSYSDIRFKTVNSDVIVFYSKSLNNEVEKLQEENEQLKQQIEKMENCHNCNKYSKEFNSISSMCFGCKNKSKWELAE